MRHSSLNVSLSCSAVVRGNRSFYRGNRTFYLRNRSFSLQTYLWLLPSQSCSWFGQEFFSLRIFFPSFQLKWGELATNWDIFDGKGQKCCDSLPHKFFCWFLYKKKVYLPIWTSLGLAVCDKMDASAGNRTRAARALQSNHWQASILPLNHRCLW